jgi:hypothetical protein
MNPFKDVCNRWMTSGLFYELYTNTLDFAIFTLDDDDKEVKGKKLKSIKKLYMSCTDPTEYEFANKHLGGWAHWKELQECKLLIPYIDAWRDEMEIKLRAEAIKTIAVIAKTDKGYQAAKFLADCGWKLRAAGAPSKEEKEGHKKKMASVNTIINNDAKRLGIVKVN